MRLLLIGLVLFAVGVGFKEYERRHPSKEVPAEEHHDDEQTPAPAKGSGPEALLETMPATGVGDEPKLALEAFTPEKGEGGFDTVLKGEFNCGDLKHGNGFAVFVDRHDKKASLVRVEDGQPPKVLATTSRLIAAVAIDGDTVLWAEGSMILKVPADGSTGESALVAFRNARVTSLAARDGTTVAVLVPVDADPLSDEPEGAVVRIDAKGNVKLVAGLQVRAHDVATDGKEAVWVSGYPSGLSRATLDGSSSGRIAERADGPVVILPDRVLHRYPQTGSPELRSVGRSGGSMQTIAAVDADWFDADEKAVWYTTAGFGARLYEKVGDAEPKDVMELGGASAGVADFGTGVVVLVQSDATCLVKLHAGE